MWVIETDGDIFQGKLPSVPSLVPSNSLQASDSGFALGSDFYLGGPRQEKVISI